MDPQLPSQKITAKSDVELQEHFTKVENRWEAVRALSNTSRTNFNEKLAVLSAGSLALLGTASTTLYNKPLSSPAANHDVLLALGISAILLWISLCLSTFHNLCDSFSFEEEARMYMAETRLLMQIRRIMDGFDGYADYVKVDAERDKYSRSVEHFRRNQRWLSFAAFALFAAGYADIIWMMIHMQASAQPHP